MPDFTKKEAGNYFVRLISKIIRFFVVRIDSFNAASKQTRKRDALRSADELVDDNLRWFVFRERAPDAVQDITNLSARGLRKEKSTKRGSLCLRMLVAQGDAR